jgi:hypothetical protein
LAVGPLHGRVPLDEVFGRAHPLQVAGVEVHGLEAEDDFVSGCGHLAQHQYALTLARCFELALVVQRAGPTFDWDAVVSRAGQWKVTIPLQRVVARIDAFWPGAVPADALHRIFARRPWFLERWLHDGVVGHHQDPMISAALRFLADSGPRKGLGRLLGATFPGPVYLRERYGDAPLGLWPLLYLQRVATLVQELTRQRPGTSDAAGGTSTTQIS